MNIRVILFNGIMTALIGAMLGLAVAHIGQRAARQKIIIIGGASLGFGVGAVAAAVRQQQQSRGGEFENFDR